MGQPRGSRPRPRLGSYALGMAGATRRRHRQPRSAPAFIPSAIGTRVPPTAPAPETPPEGPAGLAGAAQHPQPAVPPAPAAPQLRGKDGRGPRRGAGMEAAAPAPPPAPPSRGGGEHPPAHPARSAQSTAPPGHPWHAERAQAQILHRRGTLQVPGRCWRREELPAPSRHRRGRSPALGASGQPRGRARASVCDALYIDELQPLKLLNPSPGPAGFIGSSPPSPLLPVGRCWGGRQGPGMSPPGTRAALGVHGRCQVGRAEARGG